MVVDHDVARIPVTGQVYLADAAGIDAVHPAAGGLHGGGFVAARATLLVQRIQHQVVHVQQQAAAGLPRQLLEAVRLGQRVVGQAQIGTEVFHQQRLLQMVLHLQHVGRHDLQRGFGVGHRQQVVGVHQGLAGQAVRSTGKTGVVADPQWLHARHQCGQAVQVPGVQPGGRTQRRAHAVQANRPFFPRLHLHGQGRTVVAEEVFAVHFHKGQRGWCGQQRAVMRLPEPDADPAPGAHGVHRRAVKAMPRIRKWRRWLHDGLRAGARPWPAPP